MRSGVMKSSRVCDVTGALLPLACAAIDADGNLELAFEVAVAYLLTCRHWSYVLESTGQIWPEDAVVLLLPSALIGIVRLAGSVATSAKLLA